MRHANLSFAQLTHADLSGAHLDGATLYQAKLTATNLSQAQLTGAILSHAQLTHADLSQARLDGTDLQSANLERVQLSKATLITAPGIGPCVADVSWSGTNLSVASWSEMVMPGDEDRARHKNDTNGTKKKRAWRLHQFQNAMRATHQLAVALQGQGLTTDASRFAYRAKVLERIVRWYELPVTWNMRISLPQNSQGDHDHS